MRDCALPPKQGLYDPRNEHDACGIGFLANIKNRKSHDIIQPRAGHSLQPAPSRRGRRRSAGRRRRRHPDPDARRVPARGMRPARLRAAGARRATPSAWCSCRATATPGRRASTPSTAVVPAEGQILLGWRDVPTDNSVLGFSVKPIEPVIRQVFIAPRRRVPRRRRLRAQAVRHPQAGASRDLGQGLAATPISSTFRRCRRGPSSTRA